MKESPAEDAKSYMSTRQVPQLFESLMTGLMFHRPDDHLEFLIDCLQKVKESGSNKVNWNAFVEPKHNNVLPPISSPQKHDSSASSDENDPVSSSNKDAPREITKMSPLPPIGTGRSREPTEIATPGSPTSNAHIDPSVPIIIIIAPPGCEKQDQCQNVVEHYKHKTSPTKYSWAHVSVGEMVRQRLQTSEKSRKWEYADGLVSQGEMVPDDIIGNLVQEELKSLQKTGHDGFIFEGYPRTMDQVSQFNRIVGHVDLVVLLDCSEDKCTEKLSERWAKGERSDDNESAALKRLDNFKSNTMQVTHYFETEGKLVQLSGDRDSDSIFSDICDVMDVAFYGSKPATAENSKPESPQSLKQPSRKMTTLSPEATSVTDKDKGRMEGFPEVPIIFVIGGPGCGKELLRKRLENDSKPGLVNLSMGDLLKSKIGTEDGTTRENIENICDYDHAGRITPGQMVVGLLMDNLQKHPTANGFVVWGFPHDNTQLDYFYQQVGGLTKAILVECDEETLAKNVEVKRETTGHKDDSTESFKQRMGFYKSSTLPVTTYLDGQDRLTTISMNDRNADEVYIELSAEINLHIPSASRDNDKESVTGREGTEVAEEEVIVAAVAHTTGDTDSSVNQSKEATEENLDTTEMADLKGKKVIFVVGGPGCGKGTQCAKIVEKYGFCHLSSGDLLREEVQSGSERGKELNTIMESGALVSLDIVLTLLKEAMLKNTSASGFLIDGYPRELEQGTRFESELIAPACVLYFEVPDEVMVGRLLERAKTSGRVDDNEETIKKRLKTFHDHCDKVLGHYETKGLLCKINAEGGVDDIFGEVTKKIDSTN